MAKYKLNFRHLSYWSNRDIKMMLRVKSYLFYVSGRDFPPICSLWNPPKAQFNWYHETWQLVASHFGFDVHIIVYRHQFQCWNSSHSALSDRALGVSSQSNNSVQSSFVSLPCLPNIRGVDSVALGQTILPGCRASRVPVVEKYSKA